MKPFDTIGAAYKYAENSSRKNNADRYVVKALTIYYVVNDPDDINERETILAHFKNGEKQ